MSVYIKAARSAPRSESANSDDFLPRATPAQRALGGVVRETDPAVMEESGEGSPAREHVVDRLGNRGMAREFGALGAHPVFQPGDQGGAPFAPRAQTLLSGQSIDLALDVKKRVDAFDGLQSDRRDRRRILAAPRIGGDVGQLEELASRMAPA